jgi:hypothetical protein
MVFFVNIWVSWKVPTTSSPSFNSWQNKKKKKEGKERKTL